MFLSSLRDSPLVQLTQGLRPGINYSALRARIVMDRIVCSWRVSNFQFPIAASADLLAMLAVLCLRPAVSWPWLCLLMCAGRNWGMCGRRWEACFLATVYARDAAHNSPQGKRTFIVGEEDFADAAAAVVPALQDGQMLHQFQSSF